ncbi:MAG: MFS transporter [Caulobacteraceae bacterium]
MTSAVQPAGDARTSVVFQLIPFSLAAFLGFLAIGVPLPVLPGYINHTLGFGPVVVGLVIGLQSLVTLLTRQYAGQLCDRRGPKRASLAGLGLASLSGLLYLASSACAAQPLVALAILVCGRLVLGLAESLFITALAAWSIARVGHQHAGRAMAWSGIAMYGALAIGAPLGTVAAHAGGFPAAAACAVLLPGLGALLAWRWTDAPLGTGHRASFLSVLRLIWAPGLAMALASSGIGVIVTFLALRYQTQGWTGAGFALTGFGVAYIGVRLVLGHLPDRVGGYRTAIVCLLIEAAALLLIWQARSGAMALAGATLTGLGYSLVFPSLGVEAIRRVGPERRGLALGAYLACFDLGLAMAGPVAGVVAQAAGLASTFVAGAVAAVLAMTLLAVTLFRQRQVGGG